MLTVGILLLCNVVAQQTPASNHNPATAAKTATTAKPHAAVSEEAEWNRALQLNSEAGYMDFYKKFPNTGRLVVLQGTLEAEIGGGWGGNGVSNSVTLKLNGSQIYRMSVDEATKWDLVTHEVIAGGVSSLRQRPPIPNARIIMLKDPSRIVAINTSGNYDAAKSSTGEIEHLGKSVENGRIQRRAVSTDSLVRVVEIGDLRALRTRLSSGANPNQPDDSVSKGWTALMAAAYSGNVEAARLLLNSGAAIGAKTQFGKTALDIAVGNGKTEVADLLSCAGSAVELQSCLAMPSAPDSLATSADTADIQRAFDKASASNTVASYRSFLALFKSDDPAPSTDSKNQTARSKLYWGAHERIEKLLSSSIIKDGPGRRFCIKDIQPKEDSITGTITINGTVDPSSDLVIMETLYPEDRLGGLVTTNGINMGPPLGNKSIIRFIGKAPIGAWTIYGDSREPLSFLLLRPHGFVYLDGRGTVTNSDGTSISLPTSTVRPTSATKAGSDVNPYTTALAAKRTKPVTLTTQKDKLSYALGVNIGESMKKGSLDIDPGILARGLRDVMTGSKPLMTDEDATVVMAEFRTGVTQSAEGALSHFQSQRLSFYFPSSLVVPPKARFDIEKVREALRPSGVEILTVVMSADMTRGIQVTRTKRDVSFDALFQEKKLLADKINRAGIEVTGYKYTKYSVEKTQVSGNVPALSQYGERSNGEVAVILEFLDEGYVYDLIFMYKDKMFAGSDATSREKVVQSTTLAEQTPTATAEPATAAKTTPTAQPHTATAAETPQVLTLKTQKDKVSYAIGMNIGQGMKKDSLDVDPDILARGVKDAMTGAKPLMAEEEARAAMNQLRTEMTEKKKAEAQHAGPANKQAGQQFLAANKTKEGVVTLPSGLQYKIIKQGDGPKPTASDTVVTNYRGTLIDGTEFDSSYKRGEPATFPVGQVIKGWTEALQLMPVGSKWQLFIPSDLAYGEHSPGGEIGPNSTLIFDIELLSIQGKNP